MLCRAALRSLLCEHLGCGNDRLSFETAEGGKPFALLDGQPVAAGFNVSHSGQHGLIALAPAGRIGVDIEECVPRDDLDRLAGAVFGPAEQTELAAASGDDRIRLFFRLWTLKEAVAKALGSGLSLDVSQFEVPEALRSGGSRDVLRLPWVSKVQWQLTVIDDERFAAAVAQEVSGTSR